MSGALRLVDPVGPEPDSELDAAQPDAESVPVHRPRSVAVAVRVLVSVALLAAWVLLFALVISGVQEARSQQMLYDGFRQELAMGTASLGGHIAAGRPVALVDIDGLGLHRVVVVEGTDASDMRAGPGHLSSTPLPGQAGVSVVFGRSATYGGPFGSLARLHAGDRIQVTTGQGTFTYVVNRVRTAGDPVPAAPAAGTGRLLLVSSVGSGWRGGWAPTQAIYVDATLRGAPVPAPSGRPRFVPASQKAMQPDLAALFPLALWLSALTLVGVLAVVTRNRWGRWQAWVVGVPIAAAVVWAATDCAMQLLPNLL
jgi:sortase A